MSIGVNDCYGSKKQEIVRNYFLVPIAHIKMLPSMKKDGCCGELTEEFYIFSYTKIADKKNRGAFFVGSDCAHQLIDMVNAVKAKAGKPPLELPQLFDIAQDGGFLGGYKKKIKTVNFDALVLLHLLATAWEVKQFYGAPVYILERIIRNPEKTISKNDLLKVDDLISKIELFKTIKLLERDGAKIGHFTIPYFNTVLDFIRSEDERSSYSSGRTN